ncbi:MAG: response regulator [Deltaproteobacteria bacterium]|nr:response regulator [Deltaproteobacteria bacterium]
MDSGKHLHRGSNLSDLQNRLYAEQVEQIEKVFPLGLLATLINATVLVVLFWEVTSHIRLPVWFFMILVLTILRHPKIYQKHPLLSGPSSLLFRGRILMIGAGLSGILWGSTAIFLFPENSLVHQTFLAFILGGMVAGAAGAYSVLMPVFFSFSFPALVPLIIRFFILGGKFHFSMGGVLLLFALIMWGTAKRYNQTSTNNFALRLRNSDLVTVLAESKDRAEKFNEELQQEIQTRKVAEEELKKQEEQLADLVEERTAELVEAHRELQKEFDERKRLELELIKSAKLESLGVLAGGIAHDFNNLLTGIQGNISLATLDAVPGSPQESTLKEADKACTRATSLTHQLLTFSKGGNPVKTTLHINEIITETAGFVLRGSNVKCVYHLPEDLWNVEADEGQIGQVIQNLVINADHAMPKGGTLNVRGENIHLDQENPNGLPEGNYIRITFRDEGCGIDGEDLSRIFDPYFTTREGGNGLGLSSAYSILQKHGGSITVRSEPGKGATFAILLPASMKKELPTQPERGSLSVGSGRILVMDDEELIRKTLSRMLEKLGYKTDGVGNGTEALESYRKALQEGNPYRAVIMDLTIPGGMGGKEAVRKLLKIDPGAKVIVSSGYSQDEILAEYRRYGFSGIMTKPYETRKLSGVLERVLQDSSAPVTAEPEDHHRQSQSFPDDPYQS